MEDQQTPSASSSLDNFFNIAFDASTRAQVKQAALWAKICTLCAFVGYVIVLVVAFFGQQDYSLQADGEVARVGGLARIGTILGALLTTALGIIINYFLYRFATATAKGMDSMDTIKTNEGFNNLRVYFKIYGILLIIALSLVALGLLIGILSMGLSRG
jgi:NADH:ubiquinone oxidoreductase subunit 5 (subunit L)/multisubunit Na+/H+ antiporter MnhA subunit